jgi:hypothetical protein
MIPKFKMKPTKDTMRKRSNFLKVKSPPKVYFLFNRKEKTVMMIKARVDPYTGFWPNRSTMIKTEIK